jgi:sec-independent protein translocase protein TatA
MLGLDNPIHLLFVGVLLLLVFGAKRLPEMGHSLGSGLRGFKDSLTSDGEPSSIAEHAARYTEDTAAAPAVVPVVVPAVAPADEAHQPTPAQPVA